MGIQANIPCGVLQILEDAQGTAQNIITTASLMTALVALCGMLFSVFRWYQEQKKNTQDILKLKEEDELICFALSACLDGLMQLGANHTVPRAKEKLDQHLNHKAHT